jgi:glycosyltransferase involved in cell wall biosynthesis
MAGVPVRIHTFTGLIFPSKKGVLQQLLIAMDRLLCWAATTVIPEGNGVKNDLITYKITSKSLVVLANGNVNGIDTHYFSPEVIPAKEKENLRKALQLEPSDFVYVFVGRLVGDKGINELVAAFKNLSNANVKLLLVGPYEKELDALKAATLQEIEQNKNILTVGFQQDVRAYFAISDALIFPSYREGFPNVVMQAGAMGLPSIVTNINGCNEIITEGVNGTIIPVKDAEAIYIAMKKMINEVDFRSHLQYNARQIIVSRYEQKVVWEAILAEYKSIGNAV